MVLRFRVLGPLEIDRDGVPVDVSAAKQRVILASLLLEPGRLVSADRLIRNLWGTTPARTARQTLQVYVARLRHLLGDDVVATGHDGYRIAVGPGELDLLDFGALLDRAEAAERAGEDAAAIDSLTAALALWRGEVLGNVPSDDLHGGAVPGLLERLLRTTEHRLDLALRVGRDDVVAELRRLTSEHPLRERLWELLIRALAADGRQAEALATYQEMAQRLVREVGIEPGPELRRAHEEILAGGSAAARPDPGPRRGPPPRQLPADVGDLVGRAAEVGTLTGWLTRSDVRTVAVVSGPPGVGKTALAVHAAHRVGDRYPDGQLYADLRGFSPASALPAAEVLARFLRGLGLTPDRVPVDPDEQAARYRSVLADRRVLVVLDNARSVEQVRPLLPAAPGCDVIVTSRSQLRGLLALDGARALPLDVLAPTDAQALLAADLGAARIAGEVEAAHRLTRLCGRLPLALRIVAANLAMDRHRTIGDLVADLSEGDRLDSLALDEDAGTQVVATFDLSYAALDEDARALFRALALVPGPDFTRAAVVALAGGPARRLDVLVNASLVQAYAPDRYRLHDLVRDYAGRQAESIDTVPDRTAARGRLFGWYLGMVDAAVQAHYPSTTRLPRPAPDRALIRAADVGWLDEELPNLVAAVTTAADHGPVEYAWHLADALRAYLSRRGRLSEQRTIVAAATMAAEQHGDLAARAATQMLIGSAAIDVRDLDTAIAALARAVDLHRAAGVEIDEAAALHNLAVTKFLALRTADAVTDFRRALAALDGSNPLTALTVTSNLANALGENGQLAEAIQLAERALNDSRRRGAEHAEAYALTALGHQLRRAGRYDRALPTLSDAVSRYARLGDPIDEGRALVQLVRGHCDAGRHDDAWVAADRAQRAAQRLDHAEVTHFVVSARAELAIRTGAVGDWPERLAVVAEELSGTGWLRQAMRVLDVLGYARLARGDHAGALAAARRVLGIAAAGTLPHDAARTLQAAALLGTGDPGAARTVGLLALDRHRTSGYRLREARTECVVGDACAAGGDAAAARAHWRRATEIYASIGTPEAAEANRRLTAS